MPGSPPRSSTEPRTKPPPVTRSSSAMPDARRGASLFSPASDSSLKVRPFRLARRLTGPLALADSASSASVFHSPQASHLPCQRPKAAPQFWQIKDGADLAMESLVKANSAHSTLTHKKLTVVECQKRRYPRNHQIRLVN